MFATATRIHGARSLDRNGCFPTFAHHKERCIMATKTKQATANGAVATAANLQPLGDRVVVKPAGKEEMTKSGIVLPDTAKEKPQRGTIVAAGQGRRDDDGKRVPLDVKVGDEILFAKYAGTEFKLDEEDLLILSEKDILAVVSE
jgi:chaperonin GroES